jgi:hypothetical protein
MSDGVSGIFVSTQVPPAHAAAEEDQQFNLENEVNAHNAEPPKDNAEKKLTTTLTPTLSL